MSSEQHPAPSEDLRGPCQELAAAFQSPDGLAVARHLARMLTARTPDSISPPLTDHQKSKRVGVWEQTAAGDFTRSPELSRRWAYWANVNRIPPKRNQARVVLLGESVARGFLYDPAFNLAKAMERMLNAAASSGFEVVDLACTNQTMPELVQTLHECLELQPDALVVFAGNNWSTAVAGKDGAWEALQRSAVLRNSGIVGLKTYLEAAIAAEVKKFVAALASLRDSKAIPIVFVIPEFNLLDWRDARPMSPHLPEDRDARWHALRESAYEALRDGAIDRAELATAELAGMDQGTSAWSLRVRAEAALRANDSGSARQLLEQSRDAELWDHFPHTPRCYSVVQSTLREALHGSSISVIDLPKVFADCYPDQLPGRRLFIDYCHLSIEGIRCCAAHVVAELSRLSNRAPATATDLVRVELEVDPRIEAQAHFAAAIHNAHWGYDCDEIVEYHCRSALRKDPGIADQMRYYVDLLTRSGPAWACSSTHALAESAANPALARYILGMLPQQPRVLDEGLLSIVASLAGLTERWQELRIREYARRGGTTNLLEPLHSLHSLSQREAQWVLPGLKSGTPDYYRSFDRCSEFYLFEDEPGACELRLTARIPTANAAQVFLDINGRRLADISLGNSWQQTRIPLAAEHLSRGLNRLTVRWPAHGASYESAVERAASLLERGHRAELFPVFGEIHSFECGPAIQRHSIDE